MRKRNCSSFAAGAIVKKIYCDASEVKELVLVLKPLNQMSELEVHRVGDGRDRRQISEDARSHKYMLCRSLELVRNRRKYLALNPEARHAQVLIKNKETAARRVLSH